MLARTHQPEETTPLLSQSQSTDAVRHMVSAHLDSCPGDWELSSHRPHKNILQRFLSQQLPSPQATTQAAHLVEWREHTMDIVDSCVCILDLPRPLGKKCAQWDRRMPIGHPMDTTVRSRRHDILAVLSKHGRFATVVPWCHECEFGGCGRRLFDRPVHYMAACMALAGLDDGEALQLLAHLSALGRTADDSDDENLETGMSGRLAWASIVTQKELGIRREAKKRSVIARAVAPCAVIVGTVVGVCVVRCFILITRTGGIDFV